MTLINILKYSEGKRFDCIDLSISCLKAKIIFIFIVMLQLFYVCVLTKFEVINLFVLILLAVVGFLFISLISLDLSKIILKKFDSNYFFCFCLVTAVSTLVFSRFEYIVNTINYGLADTRTNDGLGAGGLYSVINVMFYPLAILSVFYNGARYKNIILAVAIIGVGLVDVLFIGTRNSVFFVIFFILLFSSRISIRITFKSAALILGFFIFAIYLFEYTTRVRSGYDGLPSLYWLEKSLYSEAMSMSEMNESLYIYVSDNFWYILPLFYFISYVSHPIPELSYFLNQYSDWFNPTLLHLKIYFANATFQDSTYFNEVLEKIRFRPGYYQTLYASLLVDFGLGIVFLIILYFILRRLRGFFVFQIYLLPVVCLSTIENYFYTGLTPLRFVFFVFFASIFLKRSKLNLAARSIC